MTIRARRAVAAALIALGILLGAAPAGLALHQHGWESWTVAPPFEEDDDPRSCGASRWRPLSG